MGARVRGWRWMEVPVSAMCQLTISRFRVESGDSTPQAGSRSAVYRDFSRESMAILVKLILLSS
jgi:hypothetical protein